MINDEKDGDDDNDDGKTLGDDDEKNLELGREFVVQRGAKALIFMMMVTSMVVTRMMMMMMMMMKRMMFTWCRGRAGGQFWEKVLLAE